ncbi:hypothetical protein L227DRAFT_657328 [Lentinus tigrinus ALCF2SS1-6]|uniref:Fungal-type protein kinase domain-containing protein n=1 Tax=Lentinus tigrinus ALCF2SS1-6 TaxID=1328759 RepID=A0A5C2RT05_9APHY|nr:hypothetical protein L227DRAFT_657328 [Lentinus tigrinus ALCF2SS1-6]
MSISTTFLFNSEATRSDKYDVKEGWRHELAGRINVLNEEHDTVEDYLATYIPSIIPCRHNTGNNAKKTPFAEWLPKKGEERKSYPDLIRGLGLLIAGSPKYKCLTFLDTSQNIIPFPIAPFAHNDNGSKPDISVSFPGKTLRIGDWQQISMIIDAKSMSDQDPFPRQGTTHTDAIIPLAVSARNVMLAHGLLAVFVLGIYGDDVRIARFDHSCAVVSKPFSLKKDHRLLRQFFWRFTHPINVNIPFVGWDPTVRKLSADLQATLKKRLEVTGLEVPSDLSKARRVLVYKSETSNACKAYILFKLLDVNSCLFSRSTMVWVAVEDNADLYNPEFPLRRFIVKDSWRQIIRTSEKEFYQRLDRIPENLRYGLPRLLLGGDLGERAVAQWMAGGGSLPYNDASNTAIDAGLKRTKSSSSLSSNSSSSSSSAFSAFSGSSLSSLSDESDNELDEPIPFPEQQTFTWRSTRGRDKGFRERSHMRFVIDIVGRPITSFRSTKELITAMRDAIIGHKLACEHAGVLHRDISVGNILIVENRDEHPFAGFLHDFDYSSILDPLDPDGQKDVEMEEAEPAADPERSGRSNASSMIESQVAADEDGEVKKPKERTGTFYFMAVQLLDCLALVYGVHHDLESYYWVLLWVLLRHARHDHPDGDRACSTLFKYVSDTEAGNAKRAWLDKPTTLGIKGNRPLTRLLKDLHVLVNANLVKTTSKCVPLTHDSMLEVFNKALERNDWPTDDAAIPFKLPDPPVQIVVEARVNTKGSCDFDQNFKRHRSSAEDIRDAQKPRKRPKPAQARTREAPPRNANEKAAAAARPEEKSARARPAKKKSAPAKAQESARQRNTRARRK